MAEIDYGSIGASKQNYSSVNRLKISPNTAVRIRPLGKPVEINSFYNTIKVDGKSTFRRAIFPAGKDMTDEDRELFNKFRQKYPEIKPSTRYAVNVIDMSDGEVKVYEGSATVFGAFKDFYEDRGHSPGGAEGAIFTVRSKLPDGAHIKDVRYTCQFYEKHTLDENQAKDLRKKVTNLTELYKVTPMTDLEKVLMGEDESSYGDRSQSSSGSSIDDEDDLAF